MTLFTQPWIARTVAVTVQGALRIDELRRDRHARTRLPEFAGDRVLLTIPTSNGAMRAWIYRPPETAATTPVARPAVHLNLHGGGFVLGFPQQDDPLCRALAALSGAVVVNLDYVLAPQHPFPSSVEQAYEVAVWAAGPGSAYGWDGDRVTIGGQSAGGSISAAVARLALERGGPRLALQVQHYTPLDLSTPLADKPCTIVHPRLKPWMGDVFDTCYLPDLSVRADRLASPAGRSDQADLTGITPALVIAAEQDPLLAESELYADRLRGFGALREFRLVRQCDHGYDQVDDDAARATYAVIAEHLRSATSSAEPR